MSCAMCIRVVLRVQSHVMRFVCHMRRAASVGGVCRGVCPPPGGRLGADQHVSSLVGVKMLCVIFLMSTQSLSTQQERNGRRGRGDGRRLCSLCHERHRDPSPVIIDDDGVCVASDIV